MLMARAQPCLSSLRATRYLPSRLALLATLPPILSTRGIAAAGASNMASLADSGIVPDVVDRVSEAMAAELVVSYGGKAIENGQLLLPAAAAQAPSVKVKGGAEGGLFTCVMSDPDAPDPAAPAMREWLHWVVTNIPAAGEASQGTEVTSYRGPSPPKGTHRYVFSLFLQPNQEPLQASDPSGGDAGKRGKFSTRAFAASAGLGDPVAVSWFNSKK